MTDKQSDTPRTDALVLAWEEFDDHGGIMPSDWIVFSRKLERELAAALEAKQDAWAHYSELTAKHMELEQRCAELEGALKQFAECDLHDGNCASLEVATRRVRNIARSALKN